MITMQDIMEKLDDLQHQVFLHTLTPKSLDELLTLRQEALDLKDAFLNCSFAGTQVEVLDQLRFELVECELTAHLLASEAAHQVTDTQRRQLTEHELSVCNHGPSIHTTEEGLTE